MRPLAAVILAAAMALPALAAGALAAGMLAAGTLAAGTEAASEVAPMPIGYLEITGDERYDRNRSYAGIQVRRRWRPVAGAELAVRGSRVLRRALKVEFSLERGAAETAAELVSVIGRLAAERGVRFFLIDAPATALTAVAEGTRGKELLLFNVSEAADGLRGDRCQANLMHSIPSHAMVTDALAQYLVAKKWRDVLVLEGFVLLKSEQTNAKEHKIGEYLAQYQLD